MINSASRFEHGEMGGGKLYGEYDNSGVLIREYVWLNGEPLAQIDKSGAIETVTYLHTDHLATPRYGTNAAGSTVWTWDSGAFGKETPTGSTTVNFRFLGQYFDSETTLFYNWNRYYNSAIGRYISSDSLGLAAGINTFGYVDQSPVNYPDPLGLARKKGVPSILDHMDILSLEKLQKWLWGPEGGIEFQNYTSWFEATIKKTLSNITNEALSRIAKQICANPGKKIYPGLIKSNDQYISIAAKYSDNQEYVPDLYVDSTEYTWWFDHRAIGDFSVKTTAIAVDWKSASKFQFATIMYALDRRGGLGDPLFLVPNRTVIVGAWALRGTGCCSKGQVQAVRDHAFPE